MISIQFVILFFAKRFGDAFQRRIVPRVSIGCRTIPRRLLFYATLTISRLPKSSGRVAPGTLTHRYVPAVYDGAISGPVHGRRWAPVECAPAGRVARRRQVAAADAARARVCRPADAARAGATARTAGGRRGFLDIISSCAASVAAVRCPRPRLFSSSCRPRVRCVRFNSPTTAVCERVSLLFGLCRRPLFPVPLRAPRSRVRARTTEYVKHYRL